MSVLQPPWLVSVSQSAPPPILHDPELHWLLLFARRALAKEMGLTQAPLSLGLPRVSSQLGEVAERVALGIKVGGAAAHLQRGAGGCLEPRVFKSNQLFVLER